jgi:heme-degrading monooxygenase HmoA
MLRVTPDWHIAQINVAIMRRPLDHPEMAGFVARLEAVNALADESPGFVWRLQDEEGDATSFRPFGEELLINMSVWQSIEALHAYTYKSAHSGVFKRRKQWFEMPERDHLTLWWIPEGTHPTLEQARERLDHLRAHGPTQTAFTFKMRFAAPQPAPADLVQ